MSHLAAQQGLPFLKMHGLGNDFVVLDGRDGAVAPTVAVARALADRHLGVGCDQIVTVTTAEDADVALHFQNADGSAAGACGNATRCIAQREMARRGTASLRLRTARGILAAQRRTDGQVEVNLGQPHLDWQAIPLSHAVDPQALPLDRSPVAVGMGNPHCVFFVEDAEATDVAGIGARIEHDPLFPERTNVEFAEVRADGTLRLRVWERGVGITLACGSGACAAAVAGHLTGRSARSVALDLDGGRLWVDWRDDGVWLAGPVVEVFEGRLSPDFLEAVA